MSRRGPTVQRIRSEETGSMLPLIAFFAALGLVVVLVVVSATSLYLARERLFTVADGAALAGAESFSLGEARLHDGTVRARLSDAGVRAAVDDYLDALPGSSSASRLDLLVVDEAVARAGGARVRLSATWHPPVVSILVPEGVRISVTSSARPAFR